MKQGKKISFFVCL